MTTRRQTRDAWETLDVVKMLESEPGRHWNQKSWCEVVVLREVMYERRIDVDEARDYCGFVGCYAGWRAHMDGAQVVKGQGSQVRLPDGRVVSDAYDDALPWENWLAERLGLTLGEVFEISDPGNSLQDLRIFIKKCFGPRPADLPKPDISQWLASAKSAVLVEGVGA